MIMRNIEVLLERNIGHDLKKWKKELWAKKKRISYLGLIKREREGGRGRERILPLDCMMLYDLTMYTVHVNIAHWIHCSTAIPLK